MRTTFVVYLQGPRQSGIGKRFSKAPKLLMADTGLMTSLLGIDTGRLTENRVLLAHLAENFVAMELIKQVGWSRTACKLFHYRTRTGVEVDLLLEDAGFFAVRQTWRSNVTGEGRPTNLARSEQCNGRKLLQAAQDHL